PTDPSPFRRVDRGRERAAWYDPRGGRRRIEGGDGSGNTPSSPASSRRQTSDGDERVSRRPPSLFGSATVSGAMIAPARIAAYDILSAVSSGRSDVATAVAASRGALRDPRDRALAAEIALGVQRWRGKLDHLISHYGKRPIDRLDSEVLEILRLGVYQLLHLTRVPAAAVVHDGVNLTRHAGKPRAAGLVNAVLRAVSRNRRALPLPERPHDLSDRAPALDYLSVTLSHPRWLVERWYDRLGPERTEAWLVFNNRPAPLTLRANRPLHTRDGLLDDLTP